jgi:hypothetical protein
MNRGLLTLVMTTGVAAASHPCEVDIQNESRASGAFGSP